MKLTQAAELDGNGNSDAAEVGAVLWRRVSVVAGRAGLGRWLGVGGAAPGAASALDNSGRAGGGESAGEDGAGEHFD